MPKVMCRLHRDDRRCVRQAQLYCVRPGQSDTHALCSASAEAPRRGGHSDPAAGSAAVFGYSSGATLALKAAAAGLPISKLVLYEPPFRTDDSHPGLPAGFAARLAELASSGRRGDAVELYQTQAVGIPEAVVAQLRNAPFWPGLEAIAHTLAYDAAIIGDLSLPAAAAARFRIPALVICGENSPPFLRNAARPAAAALPSARLAVLPGQTHDIDPQATAPVMAEFLAG
jgi:pimeloyl-ACP methyl ester carboxylesterase